MNIDLLKLLKNNNIAATDDAFFRQNDPYTLIGLSKYLMKSKDIKVVGKGNLQKILEIDSILRAIMLLITRRIEDKLTGSFINDLAFDKPDYYLKFSNFDPTSSTGNGARRKAKLNKVNNLLIKLRQTNDYLSKKYKIYGDSSRNYVTFDVLLGDISLNKKIKIYNYSKKEHQNKINRRFGTTDKDAAVLKFYFKALNDIRNKLSHHKQIIDYKVRYEGITIDIFEFIRLSYFMAGVSNTRYIRTLLNNESNKKYFEFFKENNILKTTPKRGLLIFNLNNSKNSNETDGEI